MKAAAFEQLSSSPQHKTNITPKKDGNCFRYLSYFKSFHWLLFRTVFYCIFFTVLDQKSRPQPAASSDVSGGREEPMPENTDQGEDHQHQTDWEESAGEDEAATSGHVVEGEGFSGDPGNRSRGQKSDDADHSDDKDTQPPAATEQIGSETSEDWNIQVCHTQEQLLVTITTYINSHFNKIWSDWYIWFVHTYIL